VKKEGFGGGGTKVLKFVTVQGGDIAQFKSSGKIMTVSIGQGLPKNSREYALPYMFSAGSTLCIRMCFA